MKVLVFLEQRNGKLKGSSLEALSAANKIAGGNAGDVTGLILGENASALAAEAKEYGADTILAGGGADFNNYSVMNYTKALCKAIDDTGAEVVIGSATPMGRDLFSRAAARKDCGLITDLTGLALDGGFQGGIKPVYAGKALAEVRFEGNGARMATLRPNVFAAEKVGGAANVTDFGAEADGDSKMTLKEFVKGESDTPDLTEASVIISGGRAMGSADKFSILSECADVLGATVGASRAAVDQGYADHSMQVGQTGKTVSPNLYIACGISGMIQHLAGMRTSKYIVAINTDPDAPIFGVADYGIVADLFEAVPALTQKLKEVL